MRHPLFVATVALTLCIAHAAHADDTPACGTPAAENSAYCIPPAAPPPAAPALRLTAPSPTLSSDRAHAAGIGLTLGGIAVSALGVTAIALVSTQLSSTHCDQLEEAAPLCQSYFDVSYLPMLFAGVVALAGGITMIGFGGYKLEQSYRLLVAPTVSSNGGGISLVGSF